MEVTNESKDAAKVYAALVHAQSIAPAALGKVDYNQFANFDYVSADRMIIAGRNALMQSNLALVSRSQVLREGYGSSAATLSTTYRLVHSSGEWVDFTFESPVVTKKGTPEDKGTFGACTESLGYMYRGLLSIGRLDPREVEDVSSRDDRDHSGSRDDRRDETPPASIRSRASDGDGLADEFIAQIQKLAAADPSLEVLRELEQIPPTIKRLNFSPEEYRRLVDAYNGVIIPLRDKLGIAA